MHSGGDLKEQWAHIFIEAPKNEAEIIFYNRFGHSPDRVTCTCCGEDYAVDESDSLEQATTYLRNSDLEEYLKSPEVLIIRNEDIKPEERLGNVPKQGYVWVD